MEETQVPVITKEAAARIIAEEEKAATNACRNEIAAVLRKYNRALNGIPYIDQQTGGIRVSIGISPVPEQTQGEGR